MTYSICNEIIKMIEKEMKSRGYKNVQFFGPGDECVSMVVVSSGSESYTVTARDVLEIHSDDYMKGSPIVSGAINPWFVKETCDAIAALVPLCTAEDKEMEEVYF